MIKEFQGEYRWLSNFWPVQIEYNGRKYKSVEHAYMSQKNLSDFWQDFCSQEEDVKKINKLGKIVCLRDDWEEVKLKVMEDLVRTKFQNQELRKKLLETDDEIIQEGNDWNDIFWGVDLESGEGKNNLGKIIMKIRDEIK